MTAAKELKSLGKRRLVQYSAFLSSLDSRYKQVFHLGTTTQRYFYLAELQIITFEDDINVCFRADNAIDYTEVCYSSAYGFYTLIRTTLEASKKFTQEFEALDKAGKLREYKKRNFGGIKSIVDIANDIVKHPLASGDKVVFYELGGLDSWGNIDIYRWSTVDPADLKLLQINPIKDCDFVFQYLEGLAAVYLEVMADNR